LTLLPRFEPVDVVDLGLTMQTGGSSEMITVGDVERWSGDCWLSKPSPQGIDWM